jgi:hypothetical protein
MRRMIALMISIYLAMTAIGFPLAAWADGMESVPQARVRHHHRTYLPRTHYGYYWYQWGWRTGGTLYSWVGSTFTGVTPWWW